MKHLKLFEQYLNSNFLEWFGDSKVVNKEGKPLVMYHGTHKNFDIFTSKEHRKETQGFYFTNSNKYANTFTGFNNETDRYHDYTKDSVDKGDRTPNIIPVYLSVQNPLILNEEQKDIIEDIGYWKNIYDNVKQNGYDGVISHDYEQVFVFEPTQIKSAYGNNGSFDPNNPNINENNKNTYSMYSGITEELWNSIWKDKNLTDRLTNVTSDYDFASDYSYNFQTGKYEDIVIEISNIPLDAFVAYREEEYEDDDDFHSMENIDYKEKENIIRFETLFLLDLYPYLDHIKIEKVNI